MAHFTFWGPRLTIVLVALAGSALAGACGGDDADPAAPGNADSGKDAATEADTGRKDAPTDTSADTGNDRSDGNDGNTCTTGEVTCGGRCVSTASDRSHCGRCNNPCFGNTECVDGSCLAPCAVDQGRCLGRCVSLATDNANCGQCGRGCPQGQVCNNGNCALDCGPPLTTCSEGDGADAGNADAGSADAGDAGDAAAETGVVDSGPRERYCANLRSDEANCGTCGRACGRDERCTNGSCGLVCPGGQTECSDGCHNLTTDRLNCGICGRACAAGEVCSASQCQTSCGAPFLLCNGVCVNTSIDRGNCGDCGKPCADQFYCIQGSCVPGCPAPGKICPDGRCHDVTSDNQHCGDCGKPCAPGTACVAGRCELFCPGSTKCTPAGAPAYCARLDSDTANCGTCGNACDPGELCQAPGVCQCPPGTSGPGCTAPLDCSLAPCANGTCRRTDGGLECTCSDSEAFPNPTYWNQALVRVPFSVTNTAGGALPVNFTVGVSINHQQLVTGGKALADGSNLFVVHTAGTVHTQRNRVLDPTSRWNAPDTRLLFSLAEAIPAGAKATYWLYYGGAAGTPLADPAKVLSPDAGWFTSAGGLNLVSPQLADCFVSLQLRQLGRTSFELFGYDRTFDTAAYARIAITDSTGTLNHDFGNIGDFNNPGTRTRRIEILTPSIGVTMTGFEFSGSCAFFGGERVGWGSGVAGSANRNYTRVMNIPDPVVSLPCKEQRFASP